ncbi:hypothetical protein SCHPADRAFT_144873 [Schizopora paradoxa]|uniref:Uncharacterized protein n=1 Tax=Schizopora paradoxa TaxID=27342 RepID=A0A0H2S1G4_9AGAM|nr:hypothetical protein SCHPADRAFT_144873 [Schizopora paradoxa]
MIATYSPANLCMKPVECFDKELSCFISFDNPSDALLARLSLTDGLDSRTLDLVISAIRNPAFDAREVTFTSSGDIFAVIAKSRAVQTSSLETRSLTFPKHVVPEIVLDCVFDILKVDLLNAASDIRRQYGVMRIARDMADCWAFSFAVRTLAFCSLVHSSWLLRARRALGSVLMSQNQPFSRIIRNPCFGPWTRELDLTLRSCQSADELVYLIQRMPNLRFTRLDLLKLKLHEPIASTICKAISTLEILEDLILVLPESTKAGILHLFCKLHLPRLKVLRFVSNDAATYSSYVPRPFPSMLSMPRLRTLHMQQEEHSRGTVEIDQSCLRISHLEWVRDSPGQFLLNMLESFPRASGNSPEMADYEKMLLSEAKQLTVKCVSGGEEAALVVMLERSPSLESLCIRLHSPGSGKGPLGALRSLSPRASELSINLPPMRAPTDYHSYDAELLAALRDAPSQNLRRGQIFVSFYSQSGPGNSSSDALGALCFPKCVNLCASFRASFECKDSRFC